MSCLQVAHHTNLWDHAPSENGPTLPRKRHFFRQLFAVSRRILRRPNGERRTQETEAFDIKWVQEFFFGHLGEAIIDSVSPLATASLGVLPAEEYYTMVGYDGEGLRIPRDLDESICAYMELSEPDRAKFDRTLFWMGLMSRQWTDSISASFAALVSAMEALTERGTTHHFTCPKCGGPCQHEVPGATENFRTFLETHAPGASFRKRRNEMYNMRSRILHGAELMKLDQDPAFILGWDPITENELDLVRELSSVARIAARNWLKKQSKG